MNQQEKIRPIFGVPDFCKEISDVPASAKVRLRFRADGWARATVRAGGFAVRYVIGERESDGKWVLWIPQGANVTQQ